MHGLEKKISDFLRIKLCLQKIIIQGRKHLPYSPEEDPTAAVPESNPCPASLWVYTLFQRKKTEKFYRCS